MISIPSLALLAHLVTGHAGQPAAPHQADDGLQCGARLVNRGDTKPGVLSKCGRPTFQDQRTEVRLQGNTLVTVTIDVWTYNLGPRSFPRTLTFENGRLVEIWASSHGK